MIKTLLVSLVVILAAATPKPERENLWTKRNMPDTQKHQIAEMTAVTKAPGFNPDKHRIPYLEWFEAPADSVRTEACMILISGGGYNNTCDMEPVRRWRETLTAAGIQCVALVYRTPRPTGLPYYKTAWEDGQRAVRMVRSQAKKRGYDPEKIGIISMSAGSHLGLLLASKSQTRAYTPVDKLDSIPCHINWGVLHAPAYVTTDGLGHAANREGYGPDVKLDSIFTFDAKTCPLSLHHGENDPYSPNGSTLIYRELRRRGIPAELHLYPGKGHGVFGIERGVEFIRQLGFLGPLKEEVALTDRYGAKVPGTKVITEDIWPKGKMRDAQEGQCKPYIEWHIPAELKTTAIQIIYSGGGYKRNDPHSWEAEPFGNYLNSLGMTVVLMQYRTPRPAAESGLAKHACAWEDLQRAIRVVRSEAAARGLDPGRIGIMGSSAGGHLTVMGVTSSKHKAYREVDDLDKTVPCNVQWGIAYYPAYILTDGMNGHNKHKGNDDSDVFAPEFSFDLATAPMLLLHGDADGYSAMGSVKLWEKFRKMGVDSELHTYATGKHCFQKSAAPGTGRYTSIERIKDFLEYLGVLTEKTSDDMAQKDAALPRVKDDSAYREHFDSVFTHVWGNRSTDELHSLMVIKDGKVIYERYENGHDADERHVMWSASKTFAASAVGFAEQDGLLHLNDKVVSFFPGKNFGKGWENVTVENVLYMSSGLTKDLMSAIHAGTVDNPTDVTLSTDLSFEPGTKYYYNSTNTYLLSAIITKVTSKTLEQYLDEKLLAPLGIHDYIWEKSKEGLTVGGWGLFTTTGNLGKLGLFYLQKGVWEGKRLLAESWFERSSKAHIYQYQKPDVPEIPIEKRKNEDWFAGYGYQVWICTHNSYRIDGAKGQMAIVIPEKNSVVVTTAQTSDKPELMRAIWKHIHPYL